MALDRYEISPHAKGWEFKKAGAERATRTFGRKTDAVKFAQEWGKTREFSLRIKDENNKIQEERTYPRGKDPRKSKG